jgi:hypothetical protein
MDNVRLALGVAICFVSFATGCASSWQVPQVQEIEPGTYSIGVNRSSGVLNSSDWQKAMFASIDKAGEHCHTKGQKLVVRQAAGKSIVFRCVSEEPKPQ